MKGSFQIVIDCRSPPRLCEFWSAALGYVLEPPPRGFATWDAYWQDVGVGEDDLGIGPDRLIDPTGRGPRIWFHKVDEPKTVKNRMHFDLQLNYDPAAGGGRQVPFEIRKQRVEAEASRLELLGATRIETMYEEGVDHYAVAMSDPEGNEFDIN